ncbi:transcriptional regulator [Vibrio diazotrophicus]|uniref:transcriptional regulator n=1 Tax=Vibrio diazotrophicus TaxID=685 RepID=UPI0022B00532|nr:transcriptional regulator [Vibrio diazotrophicus]MCZ4373542.1 transcriptional regulator [Vibrio diazotrophicus]
MTGIGNKFLLGDRFTFDSISNTLIDNIFDDELVRLGSNESRILLLFCQRPNEVVSRNELYDFVWREQGFEVDDSSLTQAISTLRKQLKDSTKSPQFVKTVPKRGYQLISTVTDISEFDVSTDVNEPENLEWDGQENRSDVSDQAAQLEVVTHMETDNSVSHDDEVTAAAQQPVTPKQSIDLVTKLLFLFSVLLPIFAVMFTNPTQSEFRRLASYQGVVVDTPQNHPDITEWLPSIELCINQYITLYQGEFALDKVIATGGYNDVLTLNYIHKPEYSSANITLKIVANQDEINKVCQRGKSS